MTNFNSWTWAQQNYTPITDQSIMNFGTHDTSYGRADNSTTIAPAQIGSYLFNLK